MPPQIVARAAWRVLGLKGKPIVTPQLAARWAAWCRRIDRYAAMGAGERGAWVVQILALVAGGWREWLTLEPFSLGLIALATKRLANTWRYHHRARLEQATVATHERQAIARARASRRRARHTAHRESRRRC